MFLKHNVSSIYHNNPKHAQYFPCICSHARRAHSLGWAMSTSNHGSWVSIPTPAMKTRLRKEHMLSI